jgi:hypothetical protein
LLAQGMSEEEAMIASAWETLRARQADVAATIPRDADGRPSLDDDEAAFDASMADAMGQGNLLAAATPLAMEPELSAPVYRRAPGPVDYGTGESEAGEDIYSAKEAAAYRTRVPSAMATEAQMEQARRTPLYRGGQFLPSKEDLAQFARGQVMTFDPVTGARGYSPVHPTNLPVGPGEPGRLGRRLDLERPVIDPRTGQPIQGTHKYESVPVDTPFGKHDVYRPSDAFREQLGKQEQRKRIERLGSAAGMEDADIVALASGEGPVDLEALRSAGRLRRQAGREERLAEVSRRAMERQNPTALLNDEWRNYVNASKLLGKPAGASPSDVALGREQADAAMQARMGFGRDQRSSTAEENLINNRADAERRANTDPRELASAAVAAGQLNHSDVFKYADDLVNANYSSRPGLLGVSTYFTDNEVRLGAQRLADDLQMPLEEAEKIMRRIQQDRNRNVNASNIASFFYDQ